jgi:porphyrinogen peroxidase
MILQPVPPVGTILVFDMEPGADPRPALDVLRVLPARVTVGIGEPLALALTTHIPGLRSFGGVTGAGMSFPSIQGALWVSIGGDERGEVLDRGIELRRKMKGFRLIEEVDTFRYRGGRDLTGYEDGTENPKGDAAIEAAFVAEGPLAGGSFVAVQKYVHDLERFTGFEAKARDAIIGRSFDTNDEIPDAVASAHVKRSAQESFDPPAFMVRRSMPWGTVTEHGLYFVSFVSDLHKFERVLRRMAGLEDGVVDGLLTITRAVSGGYYFCPPTNNGALDLRVLGL